MAIYIHLHACKPPSLDSVLMLLVSFVSAIVNQSTDVNWKKGQPEPWMRSCCCSLNHGPLGAKGCLTAQNVLSVGLALSSQIWDHTHSYTKVFGMIHLRQALRVQGLPTTQAPRVVASDKDFTQIATEATVHLRSDAKISWLNHLLVPSKTARGRRFLGISHVLLKNHWSGWNRYQKLDPAINLYNYHYYKQCQFKESPKGHHKFVRKIGLRTSPEMVSWRTKKPFSMEWHNLSNLEQTLLSTMFVQETVQMYANVSFSETRVPKKIPIFPY